MRDSLMYYRLQQDGKHRCTELEEQICDHIIHLMEMQSKLPDCDAVHMRLCWHNITAHMTFFVLCNMVSFAYMLVSLYKKVPRLPFRL